MEPQTYEITAPNGKVLSITGDHVPTESELHDIFAKAGVETGAPKPEPHMSAAIPGTAYSTDTKGAIAHLNNGVLDPTTRDRAAQFLTTPLAHPTGIPPIDGVTSPIGIVGAAAGAGAVYKALTGPAASAVARAIATARAAGQQITPVLKYELTKTTLEKLGVPTPIAMGAGVMLSGYRGNGKHLAPTEEVPPTAKGYDRYMPNTSGAPAAAAPASVEVPPAAAAPTSPVEAVPASTTAPAVDTPPPPPASAPKFPTQKALNELAIQARRQGVKLSEAESQAGVDLMRDHGASPEDVVKTIAASRSPSGLTLSAEEQALSATLHSAGKSGAEVESAILKARALAKKLKTPATGAVEDAVQRRNATGHWED